ncbi:MAG: metallophosphoesterase, partial [Gemmataceae bacterium]|nr:metallophosphoesterase [Gemmataceae bacterium]
EWDEFDRLVGQLTMPFFYVAGNHDVGTKESARFWEGKLGRRYYHFVYRDVLFVLLNSDDPPGQGNGHLGAEQIAWARKVLANHTAVRWTFVVVHRPLWTIGNGAKNGWKEIEEALGERRYTVVAGHVHRFQKWVRNGRHYYQLATTGGVSPLRGVGLGEFDHITWVTMKQDGPVLAHITLEAIHAENLEPFVTAEEGVARKEAKVFPVRGLAYFQGTPMPGAIVTLTPDPKTKKGVAARGVVAADGTFQLTTYRANDGAAEGDYHVTITWRERLPDGRVGADLLPARYSKVNESGLRATIRAGENRLVLELKN